MRNHFIAGSNTFDMSNGYVAHITSDGRTESVQSHCNDVALLSSAFASVFTDSDQGRLVGMYHDFGKYSETFQRRIRGSAEIVDHSSVGAWMCWHMEQFAASFAVMGHHGGLPDLGAKTDVPGMPTFFGRIKKINDSDMSGFHEHMIDEDDASILEFNSSDKFMFYTRMLFSCLVDADYLATEAFFKGTSRTTEKADFRVLEDRLRKYIYPWFSSSNTVDVERCKILKRCLELGADSKPGIFELSVPTGAGKTVSSLAFAIEHAIANGLDRIIYVIPYTSIIEQTAESFRTILGSDVVLEHHSASMLEECRDSSKLAYASENWDIPVVVTTSVEFFESLYSSKPSKCRKLHNIARSVVVFDEVQLLPINYLLPSVYAIASLVEDYKVSAVLCTATQPALRPFLREFNSDCGISDICSDELYDSSVFSRVSYEYMGRNVDDACIASRLMEQEQGLCIVNTRDAARAIYSRLEGDGNYHLSTLMYPEHRKQVIAEIKQKLAKGDVCRVVSTSLIEAGVDLDFPTVFRELSGFDSLVQAGGRCNREGNHSRLDSIVHVFRSNRPLPPALRIPAACAEKVIRRYGFSDIDKSVSQYFKEMYRFRGRAELDSRNILSDLKKGTVPFRKIDSKFNFIESDTRTVFIPTAEVDRLLNLIDTGKADRNTYRELYKYGVPIYEKQFQYLEESGYLECIDNLIYSLKDLSMYSEHIGLVMMPGGIDELFI